jgi:hypothetical protein
MSADSHPDTAGHALIAASDLQRLLSTNLLLPLPHWQEQQRRPAAQPVQQPGPAAPCCATSGAAPALSAYCSAAGGVHSAEACQPCTSAADIDHKYQQQCSKKAPSVVYFYKQCVYAVKVLW